MMNRFYAIWNYLIEFLTDKEQKENIIYGFPKNDGKSGKIYIIPSEFFSSEVYLSSKSIPKCPLPVLNESEKKTPFLFGVDKIERKSGNIILYADLIASTYYMLSRYEEVIRPQLRDHFGRYLAAYAIIFQEGYGRRPLVDEYREYLIKLLHELGHTCVSSKVGFTKVWLTHDLDAPFKFHRLDAIPRQWLKNIINPEKKVSGCIKKYITGENDPYDTFDVIFKLDAKLKEIYAAQCETAVVYFMISAKNHLWNTYRNIKQVRYKKLLKRINDNGAILGLHISLAGGGDSSKIIPEVSALPDCVNKSDLMSRHHYLEWREPFQVFDMVKAGIRHDFTLGYADEVGFRVGTCRSYLFMEPLTASLTSLVIHPMQIMEKTLDSYMGLSEQEANKIVLELMNQVWSYHGELNILWHNTSYNEMYHHNIYKKIIEYSEILIKRE